MGLIQLNRPKQLNSLNSALILELIDALKSYDNDSNVKAVVLTGNEKAFAGTIYTYCLIIVAGADISEMAGKGLSDCLCDNFLSNWEYIGRFRKPLIAAVNGYAVL